MKYACVKRESRSNICLYVGWGEYKTHPELQGSNKYVSRLGVYINLSPSWAKYVCIMYIHICSLGMGVYEPTKTPWVK